MTGDFDVPMQWIALLIASSVLGLAVSTFSAYSIFLACKNKTVLENLETIRYKTSLPPDSFRYSLAPSSQTIGNIFDIGLKANLSQIMGVRVWQWFIPIHFNGMGDGSWFPINKALFHQAQVEAHAEHEMLEQQYRYRQNQRNMMRQELISVDHPSSHFGSDSMASSETLQTGFVERNHYQETLDKNEHEDLDDLEYYVNPKGVESIPLTSRMS